MMVYAATDDILRAGNHPMDPPILVCDHLSAFPRSLCASGFRASPTIDSDHPVG